MIYNKFLRHNRENLKIKEYIYNNHLIIMTSNKLEANSNKRAIRYLHAPRICVSSCIYHISTNIYKIYIQTSQRCFHQVQGHSKLVSATGWDYIDAKQNFLHCNEYTIRQIQHKYDVKFVSTDIL